MARTVAATDDRRVTVTFIWQRTGQRTTLCCNLSGTNPNGTATPDAYRKKTVSLLLLKSGAGLSEPSNVFPCADDD